MTTYSYGIVVDELELEALEEALNIYAEICDQRSSRGSYKHKRDLEYILDIRNRLLSNPMISSFTYFPGPDPAERFFEKLKQLEERLQSIQREDPEES